MSIARLIRALTHLVFGRVNLLGFSYGVGVAYAVKGRETRQPKCLRDIKGLMAAEGLVKYAPEDEAFRLAACNAALAAKEQLDIGMYQNNNGIVFAKSVIWRQWHPMKLSPIDFGHGVLIIAETAADLAWSEMWRWLVNH